MDDQPHAPVSRAAGEGVDLESGEMRTEVVNIVERYVTGWGGEYADNPYEAAPLLAGEILSLFRPQPTAGEGEREAAGCAEPEVGRAVYERIETLLTTDPQGWERSYLCHLVKSVEETGGYSGPQSIGGMREAVACIIKERVSGPHFTDPTLHEAMDRDRLTAADAIISLLSPAAPDAGGGDKLRIAALEKQVEEARSLIRVATDAAEDEGDRLYFGSSNHADWLRDWAEKIERSALQPGGER